MLCGKSWRTGDKVEFGRCLLGIILTALLCAWVASDRARSPCGRTHEHIGYEHVLILAGSQRDHSGVFKAGSFVINSPGTRHAVVSDDGCIVLAIYEKPVRFLDNS
jgi:anti-sigma factor ChrR (cupin superfamily)